jgi:branched-chain amino acid aminotransferase
MDPASCVFHYAFECFEGMKAYKDKHGNIRLFRPHKNMARLNFSSKRVALPTFDEEALLQLIAEFVKLESSSSTSEYPRVGYIKGILIFLTSECPTTVYLDILFTYGLQSLVPQLL